MKHREFTPVKPQRVAPRRVYVCGVWVEGGEGAKFRFFSSPARTPQVHVWSPFGTGEVRAWKDHEKRQNDAQWEIPSFLK